MEARSIMVLNWTPENIINFIICLTLLCGIIFLFRRYNPPNLRVILYIRLFWIWGACFFLFEGLTSLFMEPLFSRLSGIMTIFIVLTLIITINYSLNESYANFILFPLIGLGTLAFYLAFQPDAVLPSFFGGYSTYVWMGLFKALNYVFTSFALVFFLVWIIKIRKNTPFEIKRDSNILLLGAIILSVPTIVFNITYILVPAFLMVANVVFTAGLTLITFIIRKEPKLLFVLPFTPYRIVVLNHKGELLYQHLWSQLDMKEPKLTPYLGLIQDTPTGSSSREDILEIHLKDSVIIFYESEAVRVGLFVSKASKLLREIITKFATEFEMRFRNIIGASSVNPVDFKSTSELIDKYFSIFPSRLIDEERKPLFLSKQVYKIPSALETKLKEIVKDEKEFNTIKCEIQRSFQKQLPSEFLALYEELKDEMAEQEEEEPE